MFHNIILKTSYYFLPSILRSISFFVIIPLTTFYFNPQDLGLFYVLNSVYSGSKSLQALPGT